MLKYLLSLILSLLVSISFAQTKSDTLIYYVQNSGTIVADKNAADFILFIMPENPDNNLYPILQYYPNGKRKLIAASKNKKLNDLVLQGPFMAFSPTGKRVISATYQNGEITGDEVTYYPNGNFYAQRKIEKDKILLIECRDSTGNVLTTNGNGSWIKFSSDFTKLLSSGNVFNGMKSGKWTGEAGSVIYEKGYVVGGFHSVDEMVYDYFYGSPMPIFKGAKDDPLSYLSQASKDLFKQGKTSSVSVALDATQLTDTKSKDFDLPPRYPGGIDNFYKLLNEIKYPLSDRTNRVEGVVSVSFVIGLDGTVSDLKIVSAPSVSLGEEALRVTKLSKKWIPASKDGKPISAQFTILVTFELGK